MWCPLGHGHTSLADCVVSQTQRCYPFSAIKRKPYEARTVDNTVSFLSSHGIILTNHFHFLARGLPVSFCPAHLPRISLHFEVFATFRTAESETLGYRCKSIRIKLGIGAGGNAHANLAVISDEHHPVARVARRRAEITCLDGCGAQIQELCALSKHLQTASAVRGYL